MNSELVLWHVLLALAAVVATGQILGRLFRLLGQPPVIGEVLAGILLGPSLLGRVWPAGYTYLLPSDISPALFVIAQLGVILYMFAIGLELNTEGLRHIGRTALVIATAGIAVPLVLGSVLAAGIHPHYGGQTARVPFALFVGVSLAVTAFPVLARILSDRCLTRTPLGQLALLCAAAGDVAAWCLLALVTGFAKAQTDSGVAVLLWTAAYVALMLAVARPLIGRWLSAANGGSIHPTQVGAAMVALLLSALATQWIGIHALFGAFLLGALVPHDSPLAEQLGKHIENTVVVLLLPAFFAFTGMRTEIGLVSGWQDWLVCGLIILLATAGKFGGVLFTARLTGQSWRESAALGVLMNTRGLMELIVLNVGLDLGIISPRLFAMMVIMALVTTIATSPVLSWIRGREGEAREGEAPTEPEIGSRRSEVGRL